MAAMRTLSKALLRAVLTVSVSALPLFAKAGDMQALDDSELAAVQGRDGLAFNLVGYSLSGPLTLSYTSPNGATLNLANIAYSRSDDLASTFSDPYRLNIVSRSGLADMIVLSEPANAAGLLRWQFAADLSVVADGVERQGGALVVSDLVSRGGSLALSTPATAGVDGVAFGLGLNLDIGTLALRPRGRGNSAGAMQLSGIRLGAADEQGTLLGTPWQLADATTQPGLLNAVTDGNGVASLHLAIAWPSAGSSAPLGSLQIDNLSFLPSTAGGAAVDLGASRIGTMQIQYLDVKLRGGL
jgi:hypothetical protein